MPRPVPFAYNICMVFFLLLTAACQPEKLEQAPPTPGPQGTIIHFFTCS